MKHRFFLFLSAAGLLLTLFITACGTSTGGGGAYGGGNIGANQTATAVAINNANASATAAASANATPASSSGGGSCYGRYCTQPTQTPGSGGTAAVIKLATITVGGKSEMVLTNGQGLTLYYRSSDTPSSVCSGGCAGAWPPIISTTVPLTPAGLSGKLALLTDANGSQVMYNGHPLYIYSGDSGPGQSNGQGIGGVWFVCTPGLAAA